MRPQALLSAQDVTAGYGAAPVISKVSVDAVPGEVTLVIGPNGAGKSTLIKALNGELELMSGSVLLNGEDISRCSEDQRAARGLGYVPQSRDVFGSLTVAENLQMGGYRLPRDLAAERVSEIFDRFPSLARLRKRQAQTLSGGQRRLVEIMRCLMQSPRVLLLDEPMVGVAPHLVQRISGDCARISASGVAIVIVEHALEVVEAVCDRVVVMASGQVVTEASYAEAMSSGAVREAYFA